MVFVMAHHLNFMSLTSHIVENNALSHCTDVSHSSSNGDFFIKEHIRLSDGTILFNKLINAELCVEFVRVWVRFWVLLSLGHCLASVLEVLSRVQRVFHDVLES